MYKYILESISEMEWMGVIPLLIFFTFFTILIIRVLKKDKSHYKKMENLPFESES